MRVETVCTCCPGSCEIHVEVLDGKPLRCEGNRCLRGERFAFDEVLAPVRVLTTTVLLRSGESITLLPVRSREPIPKELQKDAATALRAVCITGPVIMGDIIVENLLDTGVPIVASRTLSINLR